MSTTDADALEDIFKQPRPKRFNALFDFDSFDYQGDLIAHGGENDVAKAAVKPGRQVGKTITGGAIAADRALGGHDVMILGPFEDTTKEMMEAARSHLLTAEETFGEAGYTLGTTSRNKFEWEFTNGGRLRARTVGSDGTQIRGKNPDVVLVDEAAYIKDSIFQEVIEPFFSTHESYEFYLFSTPAGKNGYFYEKVSQDDTFYSPHWPSEICPLISEEWLEEKRRELDSTTFAQEYLGEFADKGESYLPRNVVMPCVGVDTYAPRTTRILGVDPARKGTDRMVLYDIDGDGVTRHIWSEEETTGPGFIGRLKAMQDGREVPEAEFSHGELPTQGYDAIVIEENAVGGFGADLAEADLGGVVKPVKTTSQSKQSMYQRLKQDLEAEKINLPNHRRLIDQLTSLEYEFTQHGYLKVEHPPNAHDDYPDALALANGWRTGVLHEFQGEAQQTKATATFTW